MSAKNIGRENWRLSWQDVNVWLLVGVDGLLLGKSELWYDGFQYRLILGHSFGNSLGWEFVELYRYMF